ncbi:chalcone isomerase family protein [Methylophaga sp.]|uniref:chalcone isomerase family protein n=1 Tax=Methylophaga sp. TaxID=2024840 RepID=UPI003F699BA9
MKQLSVAVCLMWFSAFVNAEVLPSSIEINKKTLQQCSKTEIKALLFVDVGRAALFTSDCGKLPDLTSERQLSFIYHREFEADDFIEASETLLQRNLSQDEYKAIESELTLFNKSYQAVSVGDRYDIRLTAEGLSLIKNGTVISHSKSTLLGNQYYQIWFGNKPFNSKLKQALLNP